MFFAVSLKRTTSNISHSLFNLERGSSWCALPFLPAFLFGLAFFSLHYSVFLFLSEGISTDVGTIVSRT